MLHSLSSNYSARVSCRRRPRPNNAPEKRIACERAGVIQVSRRSRVQGSRRSAKRRPVAKSKSPRRIRRRSVVAGLLAGSVKLGALHFAVERPPGPDIRLPTPSASWIQTETRNPDGTLALPPGLIEGTSKRRFSDRNWKVDDTRQDRLSATRSNRQLSGWILPPLVLSAVGVH